MKTIEKKKKSPQQIEEYDAVKMMRTIRDKISSETQDMTLNELKDYIRTHIKKENYKPIGK